jgi:hypothetical protein
MTLELAIDIRKLSLLRPKHRFSSILNIALLCCGGIVQMHDTNVDPAFEQTIRKMFDKRIGVLDTTGEPFSTGWAPSVRQILMR